MFLCKNSRRVTICWMDILDLWGKVESCANVCWTIWMEGASDTEVKRNSTSNDVITSLGFNLLEWICWTKCCVSFSWWGYWNKCGVLYHFKCPQINCTESYIGESGRALGDRIKEHLNAPSPIHHHSSSTGHPLSPQCFNIIQQGTQGPSRNIKEAMFICVNDPSLNRNLEKYQLPHIWDILQDTSALQVKQSNLPLPSPSGTMPPPGSQTSP